MTYTIKRGDTMKPLYHWGKVLSGVVLSIALSLASMVSVADNAPKSLDIKPQKAGSALLELARETNTQIILSPGIGDNVELPAIKGEYTVSAALEAMLQNSGLVYEFESEEVVVVKEGAVENLKKSTSSQKKNVVIEEVIITAQKREQSIYDVPISILAFESQDIKSQKLTDLKDLALAVPGLLVSDNSMQRRTYMRGLGNISGSSSMVGIYVDEISASAGGLTAQQLDLRIHDLERIEVLRGPQGTIYGQGSMAGTIRFITKDPELDNFDFSSDVEVSFTEDGGPSQSIQSVVNIPLIDDELGIRFAGTYQHAGGWIDQPIGSQDDVNDQDLINVRVKGLWQPIQVFTANAMAIVHRNEGGLSFEQEDGNITPAFDVLTPAALDDEYELYNLTLSYDFEKVNLISASNHINTHKVIRNAPGLFRPPFFSADGLVDPLINDSEVFSQELRLSSTGSGRWQWIVGGYYEDWEVESIIDSFFGFVPGAPLPEFPVSSVDATYTSESWAVFGDISLDLTQRLEIGAGLRYFEDKRTATDNHANISVREEFDTLNPRLYLNYNLFGDTKIYGSAAKGFRSGGTGVDAAGANSFEPDEVWTYELGAKGIFFEGRLVSDMAVFYTDYSDVIVRILSPGQLFASDINAGDAEIRGVEWSISWQAGDNLQLGFLGTVIDTEYTSVKGTQRPLLPGDSLDFVKDYQFTLWGEKSFTWANRPGSVRLDYNRQGPANFTNRTFPFLVESDVIDMLNLNVTWAWNDSLRLGIFGKNLLNDRGRTEPVVFSLGDGVDSTARNRPRTIGVEFGVNF